MWNFLRSRYCPSLLEARRGVGVSLTTGSGGNRRCDWTGWSRNGVGERSSAPSPSPALSCSPSVPEEETGEFPLWFKPETEVTVLFTGNIWKLNISADLGQGSPSFCAEATLILSPALQTTRALSSSTPSSTLLVGIPTSGNAPGLARSPRQYWASVATPL